MNEGWLVDESIHIWFRMVNLSEIVNDVLLFIDVSITLLALDRVCVWFQPRSDTVLIPDESVSSVLDNRPSVRNTTYTNLAGTC
jgi:hypothetical protein